MTNSHVCAGMKPQPATGTRTVNIREFQSARAEKARLFSSSRFWQLTLFVKHF